MNCSGALMAGAVALALVLAGSIGQAAPNGVAPEGNAGIAGKHPNDEGIDKDPAVVFYDGFEGGSRWDNTWGNGGTTAVVEDAKKAHGGTGCMEITMTRKDLSKEDSLGAQKHFGTGYDVLFMRYYLKFAGDAEVFHGGAHNGAGMDALSPGWPDATPGQKADGKNKFTVLLDTYRDPASMPSPGRLAVYVYHPEQHHQWGEQWFPTGKNQPGGTSFGPDFVRRPDFIPMRNRWYCYELMVKANTPGKRDGHVAFWVDGKLTADFGNLRLRDVDTLKINRVALMMSSQNKNTKRPVTIWFDDVVVATSYIGPKIMPAAKDEKTKTPGIVPPPGWGTTPGETGGN